MNEIWHERILEMLESPKAYNKEKFLKSVLRSGEDYGWTYIPTPGQLRILIPMWTAHEKRKVADIVGV